eukprot:4011842-Prorocentrum_lima.AAC.1
MTSSLVGSEMCIRDSHYNAVQLCNLGIRHPGNGRPAAAWLNYTTNAVSYTHLTLPTICSV